MESHVSQRPRLIQPAQASVLVIDVQEKLMPAISDGALLCARLLEALSFLESLELPVVLTEHCAERIGPSIAGLAAPGRACVSKHHFSATSLHTVARLAPRAQVLVAGAEAHVCVLQTVAGLLDGGRQVFVIEDLVGSRSPSDKALAVARMRAMGAQIVSLEMVYFECLGQADHPKFREMLDLIRNQSSAAN